MNVLYEFPGPVRVASHVKGESEANGEANAVDSAMVTRGTDMALSESEASKSVALLANIKALLGCTMEEVRSTGIPLWTSRVCIVYAEGKKRLSCVLICCSSSLQPIYFEVSLLRNLHARLTLK